MLRPVLREEERVTALELFFDLVFVLAITQCTALMASHPTWTGLARGLLVLAVLWWAWTGYTWLTGVVDPEEGVVRLSIFGAMAALLVAALCVPTAFEGSALLFAAAYGVVRVAHIVLFTLAGRGDPLLLRSVATLAGSTAVGVGLIALAAAFDGYAQGALWVAAVALDVGGPFFFGSKGWRLQPHHFAERHELIIIIALGESIVAIGVGAGLVVTGGRLRGGPRDGGGGVLLVALLRRRRPRRGEASCRGAAWQGAERDGPRLVLVPALRDGRGDRARRARPEDDAP